MENGRAKGGVARATRLSAEERREIAAKGAMARWSESVPQAVCGSPDHPLKVGDIELTCFVLEDGRRVLIQGGMLSGLDMKQGTAGRGQGDRLAKFIDTKALSQFVSNELRNVITNPIKFRSPSGTLAYGYEATVLADLCDLVLQARKEGTLNYQQDHIAARCEILVRGFARVGIIALVDEATGYEKYRQQDALSKILEAFVAKELQAYVQTFPADYYLELFRLRGLEFPKDSVRRPQYFGILTNNIVYKRLAPGVLEELRRVTPRNENTGRFKQKYFQRLTSNIGYPKLREHLGAVVAIMKLSRDWDEFMHHLDRLKPPFDKAKLLPFPEFGDYDPGEDDGKGL